MDVESKRIPFTEEDERKIRSAGLWGMIVSITSLVTGGLTLLAALSSARGLEAALGPLIGAGVTIVLNAWLLQASLALRKVGQAAVADQSHLLGGFRRLRSYFMTQVIVVLVAFGFGVLRAIME